MRACSPESPAACRAQVRLGFSKLQGHKEWRRLKTKLKEAGCVEEFVGSLANKSTNFVRLLKPYDPEEVLPPPFPGISLGSSQAPPMLLCPPSSAAEEYENDEISVPSLCSQGPGE
jgi:hypothetical protein